MANNTHDQSVIHEPPGIKIYLFIYLALMIGLVLTVVVAYVPMAGWNTPVAMLIAVSKAVLVVLYFMHVRYGIRLTWLVAASGFVWLAILLVFTLADYFTRAWLAP